MSPKCPRCGALIDAAPDPQGFVTCSGCGARLQRRAGAPAAAPSRVPRPLVADEFDTMERPGGLDPNATLPPWTPLKKIPPAGAALHAGGSIGARGPAAAAVPAPADQGPASLDAVLIELRAVRRVQDQILALLRRSGPTPALLPGEDVAAFGDEPHAPPVRTRRRKTVLLIDDDPASRESAVAALEKADIPVRTASDGNEGIAAIAEERPDVVVLELDLSGSMAGKDVINMIKATMEWVDIPLVLHTRARIESQREARTVHGADDFVLKAGGSAETLVSRVIAFFRKG